LEIPALAQLEVLPAHHKRLPAKAKQIISYSLALRPSCTLPDGETAFIIGVLLCCSALCLFTYSGPRTIFAACSFAIGLRMVLCARSERTVTSTEPCEHEREQLRPKLALLYLGHWSVDLTHSDGAQWWHSDGLFGAGHFGVVNDGDYQGDPDI